MQENVHQLNFLECGDKNMLSELIEVTEEYVHKMQKATTIVPSNLQDGNELIKFSQTMKCFGEFLVTNGNKLHFLRGKTNYKPFRRLPRWWLGVHKCWQAVSEEDTTTDRNLDKFTEKNNDKSIVNIQESGSTSPHSSVDSFSNYDPDTSGFMSDFLTNYTDENCDDSDYIPEQNKRHS